MRRSLLILLACVVLLLSATATADYPLLLFGKKVAATDNSAAGACSGIATLHPEDVLCHPENITGTPN